MLPQKLIHIYSMSVFCLEMNLEASQFSGQSSIGSYKQFTLDVLPILIQHALTWLQRKRNYGRVRKRCLLDLKRISDIPLFTQPTSAPPPSRPPPPRPTQVLRAASSLVLWSFHVAAVSVASALTMLVTFSVRPFAWLNVLVNWWKECAPLWTLCVFALTS